MNSYSQNLSLYVIIYFFIFNNESFKMIKGNQGIMFTIYIYLINFIYCLNNNFGSKYIGIMCSACVYFYGYVCFVCTVFLLSYYLETYCIVLF